MWCSHVMFTYENIKNQITYSVHMWTCVTSVCDLPYVIYRMWCSHVMFTCDLARLSHTCPYVITYGKSKMTKYTHVMFTCEHTRMWCSHVNTCSLEMFFNPVVDFLFGSVLRSCHGFSVWSLSSTLSRVFYLVSFLCSVVVVGSTHYLHA